MNTNNNNLQRTGRISLLVGLLMGATLPLLEQLGSFLLHLRDPNPLWLVNLMGISTFLVWLLALWFSAKFIMPESDGKSQSGVDQGKGRLVVEYFILSGALIGYNVVWIWIRLYQDEDTTKGCTLGMQETVAMALVRF